MEPPPNTREFFDPKTLRAWVLGNAKDAFTHKLNSLESKTCKLQVRDVAYDDKVHTIDDQKQAILNKYDITSQLRGTVDLLHKETGKVLATKKIVIANVPYVTERNTAIINGSEYLVSNMQRLLPGVYTKIKDSGETEAHVNVAKGVSMRVILDPQKQVFLVKIQNTQFNLYSLLIDLGVSDSTIHQTWGTELWEKNKALYNSREIEKLHNKLFERFQ